MLRTTVKLLLAAALLAASATAGLWWWSGQPLALRQAPLDVEIAPGTPAKGVAQALVSAGVETPAALLYAWFRLSGLAAQLRAGNYEFEAGVTPRALTRMLARGEESLLSLTLVEGQTMRQWRALLAATGGLKHDSAGLDDARLMAQLGRPGVHPEGRFFPDTYSFAKHSSELALLRRALAAMDKQLEAAWQARQGDLPIASPEQLLILASIVEKETGQATDRPHIAAVFYNRLRARMPLQTDPTVIYGMGERFDGNLRKRDLQADTPWNTYTRAGLPPTPIAMPGRAALRAAAQPSDSKALYFVARGDGSSAFSDSLTEHNRAVNRYQRGRP